MKAIRLERLVFPLVLAITFAMTACSGASSVRPVELVSMTGPVPPFTPGGPQIQIALKNVSSTPITSLSAQPGISGAPGQVYTVTFDISSENPLRPGQDISATTVLINGAIQTGYTYQVTIRGTLEGGKAFDYTVTAKLTPPAK